MLKLDLMLQITNYKYHYLNEKTKKLIVSMKNELTGKIMTEFAALKPKTELFNR